jgi:hypothetical protein
MTRDCLRPRERAGGSPDGGVGEEMANPNSPRDSSIQADIGA